MPLAYHRATLADIDQLVKTRILVLRAANHLPEDADMAEIERQSRDYYLNALESGSHIAYLVFDGSIFVGTGGVSFFRVMPTCDNPTGRKAYIMNMYTHSDYRRKGIASQTLDLLVREAHNRSVSFISLEATDMGRPLYEKYGFVPMDSEMYLPRT